MPVQRQFLVVRVEGQVIGHFEFALILVEVVLVVLPLAVLRHVLQHPERSGRLQRQVVTGFGLDRGCGDDHHVIGDHLAGFPLAGQGVLNQEFVEQIDVGPAGRHERQTLQRDLPLAALGGRFHEMLRRQVAEVFLGRGLVGDGDQRSRFGRGHHPTPAEDGKRTEV
jgi:hypothetical protein